MDFSIDNFFILGLPRSRTLWFSKFLSFGGVKCVHEHFSVHEQRALIEGVRGYSDTNPLMAYDFGDSPVLIIERDIEDVINSVYNAFDKPKAIHDLKQTITNYMTVYKEALDNVKPENCLRVNFDNINYQLLEIWHFLMRDIRPNLKHILEYKDNVIKTDNRNIQTSIEHSFGSMENFTKKYDKPLLNAFRITDYAVAKYIIDTVWDEISEDNPLPYTPDLLTEYWIGLSDEKQLLGCYRFHQINGMTWQGHIFMLPEHRKKYTRSGATTIYSWLLNNLDFKKIVVDVPAKFKNVIAFLESFGFMHEGTNRLSYTKDNQLWDIEHYGITKEEIEGFV